ncbi:MAG: hypothetical protein GY768_30600 [Planctomycetaceae bacterium]|nr:hypothetical protein [Planctomycetaceae bacterium]
MQCTNHTETANRNIQHHLTKQAGRRQYTDQTSLSYQERKDELMQRFNLLLIFGILLMGQYGCGHRRACSRSYHRACSACHQERMAGDFARINIESLRPATTTARPIPAPSPPSLEPPSHQRNEPTPADPSTAPRHNFDVAQKPDLLQLNQPAPPPNLY